MEINFLLSQMSPEFQKAYMMHKWCDDTAEELCAFTFFYLGGHEL